MSQSQNESSTGAGATILFVDDEEKTRKHFKRLFQKQFEILLAEDGVDALKVFRENLDSVGVIVTDQRMPNETGTEFLQKAAQLKPSVIRILSTAYADVDAAIDSVNQGGVYRYITKPWEIPELEVTLLRATELYTIQSERDELVHQKMTSVQNLAAAERIHSLAALSVFQNSGLRNVSQGLQAALGLAGQPLTNSTTSSGHSPQLELLYQGHRHFLEAAHATMPTDLASGEPIDPQESSQIAPILRQITDSDPRFRWDERREPKISWPGTPEQISTLVKNLFDGIGEILSEADTLTVTEGEFGVELMLSALSTHHGLQPLLQPNHPNGREKDRAVKLTAAFLGWAHQGGISQILPNPGSRVITLRLSLNPPQPTGDPWEDLAADLVANDLFWQRHLE